MKQNFFNRLTLVRNNYLFPAAPFDYVRYDDADNLSVWERLERLPKRI